MKRFLTGSSLALVVSLCVSILVPVGGGESAGAQSFAKILLQAQVLDAQGRGIDGLTAFATIVPAERELQRTEGSNERVNQFNVGQTKTSSSGAFSLELDSGSVPEQYLQDDGSIALRVYFADTGSAHIAGKRLAGDAATWRGAFATSLFPGADPTKPWRSRSAQDDARAAGSGSDDPLRMEFTLGVDGAVRGDTLSPVLQAVERGLIANPPTPNNDQAEDGQLSPNQFGTCTETWQVNYNNVRTKLFAGGSNSNKVEIDYALTLFDNAKVGVGFKASGAGTTWSQSGEQTATTGFSMQFPKRTAASGNNRVNFETQMKYSQYQTTCKIGGIPVSITHETRPRWIEGDVIIKNRSAAFFTNCTQLAAGGAVSRTSGLTTTFSGGVSISLGGVLDLSSRNELSGGVSHRVTFKNLSTSKTKWVCGKNAVIGAPGKSGQLMGDWKDR